MWAVPGLVEAELLVKPRPAVHMEEWQEGDPPAQERLAIHVERGGGESSIVRKGVAAHGQAYALEVVDRSGTSLGVVVARQSRRVGRRGRLRNDLNRLAVRHGMRLGEGDERHRRRGGS